MIHFENIYSFNGNFLNKKFPVQYIQCYTALTPHEYMDHCVEDRWNILQNYILNKFVLLFSTTYELWSQNENDISCNNLHAPLRSTVSAQPKKRDMCAEQELGVSWFSLRHCSNFTNSWEQSCLIFWITGLKTFRDKPQISFRHVCKYAKVILLLEKTWTGKLPYWEDVHFATFIFSSWHICCHFDGFEATHDP